MIDTVLSVTVGTPGTSTMHNTTIQQHYYNTIEGEGNTVSKVYRIREKKRK